MHFDETLSAQIFTEQVADAGLQGEDGLVGLRLSPSSIK
jgi:hypothetical protein